MLIEENIFLVYGLFFMGTLVFSVLINTLMLKFSSNLGTRGNEEDGFIRWSAEIKPSLGGLTFYIIFLFSLATFSMLPLEGVNVVNRQLFGIFSASTLGFFIGLADDAYNTDPLLKFLGQLTCANILLAVDIYIHATPWLIPNYLITIVWIVGMMNSLNMLDNMDGVTGSVCLSAICAALVIIFFGDIGYKPYTFILFGMVAALIGFLYFNWNPSRMFMGDTGSQFMGAFLSSISILLFWPFKADTAEVFQIRQFILPMIIFIMPLIDTITVFARRIMKGQSPFVGGRDHTTHQLAYLGLSDGDVSLVFALMSFVSVGLTYVILKLQESWNFWYSVIFIAYFIIVFIVMQVLYEAGRKKAAKKEEAEKNSPEFSPEGLK